MRSRTVGQSHLVLESCCAVCILQKLGLTWVVCRPGIYHSILAGLSVVHQSCPMWKIFFFLSRLPTASNNSIALLRSSPSMGLWTWTLHAPFSHQISTIPIKFRITWHSIHFTVHLCTYLASYGFCSSGCFWIETHPTSDTMLYLYVGEHIKLKQPCGETCFIQQPITLVPPVTVVLHGLLPLHPLYNMCCFTIHMTHIKVCAAGPPVPQFHPPVVSSGNSDPSSPFESFCCCCILLFFCIFLLLFFFFFFFFFGGGGGVGGLGGGCTLSSKGKCCFQTIFTL